jgi:hypothetical protein
MNPRCDLRLEYKALKCCAVRSCCKCPPAAAAAAAAAGVAAGVCMNPRCHLRLVYEANPLALLCEQAGGIASDGKLRIREIPPSKLHQRLPLFMGSPDDMQELMSYDDVQQLDGKTYTV